MNNNNLLVKTGSLLALSVLVLSACAGQPTPTDTTPGTTSPEVSQPSDPQEVITTPPVDIDRPPVNPSSDEEAAQPLGEALPAPQDLAGEEPVAATEVEEGFGEELLEGVGESAVPSEPQLAELPEPESFEVPEPDAPEVDEIGETTVLGVADECEAMSSLDAEKCRAEAYLASQGQEPTVSENDFNLLLQALSVPAQQSEYGSLPDSTTADESSLVDSFEGEAELDTGSRFDSSECSSLSNSLLQTYCQETIEMRQQYEASGGSL